MPAFKCLLWFDNDSRRSITEKTQNAIERYTDKYGEPPAVVHVSNRYDVENGCEVDGVPVKAMPNILPNHVWCQE